MTIRLKLTHHCNYYACCTNQVSNIVNILTSWCRFVTRALLIGLWDAPIYISCQLHCELCPGFHRSYVHCTVWRIGWTLANWACRGLTWVLTQEWKLSSSIVLKIHLGVHPNMGIYLLGRLLLHLDIHTAYTECIHTSFWSSLADLTTSSVFSENSLANSPKDSDVTTWTGTTLLDSVSNEDWSYNFTGLCN